MPGKMFVTVSKLLTYTSFQVIPPSNPIQSGLKFFSRSFLENFKIQKLKSLNLVDYTRCVLYDRYGMEPNWDPFPTQEETTYSYTRTTTPTTVERTDLKLQFLCEEAILNNLS